MNSSPSVSVLQERFSGDLLSKLSTSLEIFDHAEDEYEDVELESSHTYDADAKRNLEAMSREYTAILSICLQPHSFSQPTEYEDAYGGRVIDFYRGYDRITGIVSESEVQILSNLNDDTRSQVFSRTDSAKLDVLKYVEEIFESFGR